MVAGASGLYFGPSVPNNPQRCPKRGLWRQFTASCSFDIDFLISLLLDRIFLIRVLAAGASGLYFNPSAFRTSKTFLQRFPVPACRYRLARVADRSVGDFNAQELSNTAWAFAVATAGQSNAQLFLALAMAAERWLRVLNAQHFADKAWAFVMVG